MEKKMWEIFVPTVRNDGRPFRTRYHRVWDERVKAITNGLTITPPVKGVWVSREGTTYRERMILVRIMATRDEMLTIAKMTKDYYEQIAVLAYCVGNEILYLEDN